MTYALTTFRRAVAGISWQAFLGESHCLDVPSSDLDKINDIKRKINDIKKKLAHWPIMTMKRLKGNQ